MLHNFMYNALCLCRKNGTQSRRVKPKVENEKVDSLVDEDDSDDGDEDTQDIPIVRSTIQQRPINPVPLPIPPQNPVAYVDPNQWYQNLSAEYVEYLYQQTDLLLPEGLHF